MTLASRVGESIRQHRLNRGWSQKDLADRASVGQTSISRWEAGDRVMGIDILVLLSKALGIAPGVLLCGLFPSDCPARAVPQREAA